MTESPEDQEHFAEALADLGEHQEVISSVAIFNEQGAKIVDKGVAISRKLFERLKQHKLTVAIEDAVTSTNCVNGESLRLSAEAAMADIPFFGRLAADEIARKTLLNVIEAIPLPGPMALQLTVARDVRPDLYVCLVRTALIAAWLARTTALVSRYDLGMAAAAGLLHDIGMLHVDPVLSHPELVLNRDQRRQLYSHPLVSVMLLERHHQYSSDVVRAVGEHQEYLDGSGYPRNLSGDAISELGRIVSLAQLVAAMFAPGRSAPEMRLSILLRMHTDRYDPALAMRVVALLQPRHDVMSAAVALIDDPLGFLRDIHAILSQWPLDMTKDGQGMGAARENALVLLSDHAQKLLHSLAKAGVAPEQLAQLSDDLLDDAVRTELTLLTHEAGWQLRTLGREAYRRWQLQPGESYPPALEQWLAAVDALVSRLAEQVTPAHDAGDSTGATKVGQGH